MAPSRESLHQFADKHPNVTSMAKGALTYAAMRGMRYASEKAGIPLRRGNAGSARWGKFIEEHPAASAVLLMGVAPIGEELFYREGVNRVVRKYVGEDLEDESARRKRELIKLGITALFGFSPQHVGKNGIPVPQVAAGFLLQDEYDKRGIVGSTIAHATLNTLTAVDYLRKKRK